MWEVLDNINRFIWSVPALYLIIGTGIYLTIRTGFAQIRLFPRALHQFGSEIFGRKKQSSGVAPLRALCTALAATVGTGNLVGVAGAIAIGGPGSIFWMWITAFLGMVTKFAEAVLAVRYRARGGSGEYHSGPMYMISGGMGRKWRWLAGLYAFLGAVAAFGVGNATQVNAVVGSINSVIVAFGGEQSLKSNVLIGLSLTVLIGLILHGGANRIGHVAEKLVPFAAIAYILLALFVIIIRYDAVPAALCAIMKGAFSPEAVSGGVIGSAMQALAVGARRGVFTNEAGMGTAGIAHGCACVEHPVEQGFMGIVEVFLDTIVICTLTALVILCSGIPISYGTDTGGTLTSLAFTSVYGNWVNILLSLVLSCFAIATILGWGLYGMRCAQYLFGVNVWKPFVWLQTVTVFIGSVMNTQMVWVLAEIVNGLMAVPNLIALIWLSPELIRLLADYRANYLPRKRG